MAAAPRGWRRAASVRVCYRVLGARGSEDYSRLVEGLLLSDAERLALDIERAPRGGGGCDALLLLLATGGVEREALEVATASWPVAVLAHSAANSAASLAEIQGDLESLGALPVYLGALGVGSREALEGLAAAYRAVRAAAALRGSRLGLVGEPAPWLPHSPGRLAGRLGVEVARIPVEELLRGIPTEPPRPPAWLLELALGVRASGEALRRAMRVYAALRRLAEEEGLDAIAPSCPSFLEEAGSNACLAMTLLNTEGLTVGCEGDVPATITLHLAQLAAARPGFLANTAWARRGVVGLAHCGAPPSMGLAYSIERHFITGSSPTLAVWIPAGLRATLAQASWDASRLIVAEGTIASGAPWRGRQCETQVEISLDTTRLGLLGAGNHAVLLLGSWGRAIALAWRALNPGAPVEAVGVSP
ncbi:MAG: hypothetical protein GSR80_001533 [Desulfurococcales archaeon]|nr:hypothetical protein [Desulfurococcales archaeon]